MFLSKTTVAFTARPTTTYNLFRTLHSRTGSFLSSEADVPEGIAMAYLIAPPLEAMLALDAAIKAADVELSVLRSAH